MCDSLEFCVAFSGVVLSWGRVGVGRSTSVVHNIGIAMDGPVLLPT